MKKLRWLTALMGITLLVITGFQGYWLKNNYDREKRTMEIRANVNFQETVRHLQAVKFKLFPFGGVHIMVDDIIAHGVAQEFGIVEKFGCSAQGFWNLAEFLLSAIGITGKHRFHLRLLFNAVQACRNQRCEGEMGIEISTTDAALNANGL